MIPAREYLFTVDVAGVHWIDRQTVNASGWIIARSFDLLLAAVVTWRTKRLKVCLIPKQQEIATVRLDVVNDRGSDEPAPRSRAENAERVLIEPDFSNLPPSAAVKPRAFHALKKKHRINCCVNAVPIREEETKRLGDRISRPIA